MDKDQIDPQDVRIFSGQSRPANLTVMPVAPIFGEAIRRNYTRQSIGDLFSFWQETET